ncbi:MAG: hypothetical protein K1060chlam1_01489 [Candidatus Anoxychlamydiales bacterium]|nr:hypothetical protein [Candidatus Anoxychlamydiales bacterium]
MSTNAPLQNRFEQNVAILARNATNIYDYYITARRCCISL